MPSVSNGRECAFGPDQIVDDRGPVGPVGLGGLVRKQLLDLLRHRR
jgi:hypothetical protein